MMAQSIYFVALLILGAFFFLIASIVYKGKKKNTWTISGGENSCQNQIMLLWFTIMWSLCWFV